MTRRSSLRASAREIYRDLVAKQAASSAPALTLSRERGREDQEQAGAGIGAAPAREEEQGVANPARAQKNLMAQVRALYEETPVPVREIARLAGVSERTIYKYAAKRNWKPRYAWAHPRAPALPAARHPAALHALRRKLRRHVPFAPVKGAGGRFIRRDARGQPVASGLHATDPAQAARASLACDEADALAQQALKEADANRRARERDKAFRFVNRTLDQINDYREECRKKGKWPIPADDAIQWAYSCQLSAAADWLDIVTQQDKKALGI